MHQALGFGRSVGGGAVETVSGTAGQIVVTPSTGDVVISLADPLLPPGRVRVIDGTAAAPSYSFASDTTRGFYKTTNGIGLALGGSQNFNFDTVGRIFGPNNDNFLQLSSGGNINITAAGTNQSITLTPSGTGLTKFDGVGEDSWIGDLPGATSYGAFWGGIVTPSITNFAFASNGTDSVCNAPVVGGKIQFDIAGQEKARLASTGNLLLGGATDGTGRIQLLGSSGTNADGITFFNDTSLYRVSANDMVLAKSGFLSSYFYASASQVGFYSSASTAGSGWFTGGTNFVIQTSNVTALTLDSSQNATFAGTIKGPNTSTYGGDTNTNMIFSASGGTTTFKNNGATALTIASSQKISTTNDFSSGGFLAGTDTNSLVRSLVALANGAAAQLATMTNGPTAGNPTKWIPIVDNGTTRYVPSW